MSINLNLNSQKTNISKDTNSSSSSEKMDFAIDVIGTQPGTTQVPQDLVLPKGVLVVNLSSSDSIPMAANKEKLSFSEANKAARTQSLSEVRVKEREFVNLKHKMLFDYLFCSSKEERCGLIWSWGKNAPHFVDPKDIQAAAKLDPEHFLEIWINTDKDIKAAFPEVVNLTDSYGHTPLHYLAMKKNFALAKLFISQGARVDIPSTFGTTAYTIAAMDQGSDMEKLFRDHLPQAEAPIEVSVPQPPKAVRFDPCIKVQSASRISLTDMKTVAS